MNSMRHAPTNVRHNYLNQLKKRTDYKEKGI